MPTFKLLIFFTWNNSQPSNYTVRVQLWLYISWFLPIYRSGNLGIGVLAMVQSADKPSHCKLTCKCETREFDLLCDAFICCEQSSTVQSFHVFEREMTQRGNQAVKVKFCCLICLDRLKDPVTKQRLHELYQNQLGSRSEENPQLSSVPLHTEACHGEVGRVSGGTEDVWTPSWSCYAGPGDVACDVCTGRKLKAFKSWLLTVSNTSSFTMNFLLVKNTNLLNPLFSFRTPPVPIPTRGGGRRSRRSSVKVHKNSSRESRADRRMWRFFSNRWSWSIAALIEQWRRLRRFLLSWSVSLRKGALTWSSRSDPSRNTAKCDRMQ